MAVSIKRHTTLFVVLGILPKCKFMSFFVFILVVSLEYRNVSTQHAAISVDRGGTL